VELQLTYALLMLTLLGGALLGYALSASLARRDLAAQAQEHQQDADRRQRLLSERAARVTAAEQQIAALQTRLADTQQQIERTNIALQSARLTLADYEQQGQSLRQQLEALREQLRVAQAENQNLVQQNATLRQQLEQKSGEIGQLESRLQWYEAALAQAQDQSRDSHKLRERLAALEPEALAATEWRARHDILQHRLSAASREVGSLQRQLSDLQQMEAETPELLAREQRIRVLELDNAQLRRRVLQLEPVLGELQRLQRQGDTPHG
jgi:chromosome segregation ATPase